MNGQEPPAAGSSQPESDPVTLSEISLSENTDTQHSNLDRPTTPTHPGTTLDQQPQPSTTGAGTEREPTYTTLVATDSARDSDPSIGTSQLSTSHTGTDEKKEKEKSPWTAATLTMPVKARTRRKSGKGSLTGVPHSKGATSASTEKAPSISSNTEEKPPTKRRKISFFRRITSICSSCVRPSRRDIDVDVDEGASRQVQSERQVVEKLPANDVKPVEQQVTREPSDTTIVSPPLPLILTDLPPPPTSIEADIAIVVPPTPTKQLLPLDETDGLTSGAVQPPGSTGEEHKQDVHVTVGVSGDDTDGSTDDEAFTDGQQVEEWEDDEQRLIRQGGAGIPIGPDGTPQPLLPAISAKYAGKKCLVLDLDETLVHSSLRPVPFPDYIVPVEIENNWHNFYVLKRPGVDNFLRRMGDIYEVVVFTASLAKYADPVLDRLDPGHTVAHRLFRESCFNHRGNYVKDLSQLGRPIGDTIILDNSPASYIFHPYNAVPVSSWFNDPHDTELTDLCPFLEDLSITGDVRGILNPNV